MSGPAWLDTPLSYDRVPERFNIVPLLVDRHVAAGQGERPAILTPERVVSYGDMAPLMAMMANGIVGIPRMKVILRNQGKEVELTGRRRVKDLLAELGIISETVLVIRGHDLLTIDDVVREDDVVELRPVISGGRA